jgi:nucleoside-diphosphate-sugar epimerase
MSTVLVTGGTGFIAGHCILQLLAANHTVRATIRSPESQHAVESVVATRGSGPVREVCCFPADLRRDEGWSEAIRGCDYVLHVASPLPGDSPASDDDLIIPAREGTLRVLRAAVEARVKRVVITSSFSAISYAARPDGWQFTESDWTVPDRRGITAYTRAKSAAERAAWQFVNSKQGSLEISVINPVRVLGPTLSPRVPKSMRSICRLLRGGLPGVPRTHFGVVDVRDLAALHILAMTHPAARNQRFIAAAGDLTMADLARMLRQCVGVDANKIPTRELPSWVIRLAALRMRSLRNLLPELGRYAPTSSAKASQMLGWQPRSLQETVNDMVASLRESCSPAAAGPQLLAGDRPRPSPLHQLRLWYRRSP